ncbi:MAG TPA: NUDIX domain-containing protein [Rhodoglobus sp.]|nr:NUDIX domain-containing protein [Rhodoglobus sp.]
MSPVTQPPVLAAGAVCWRLVGGVAKILVVHRDARADVSLPKGKVDPGEMLPQTAVREIAEETGLAVNLGAPLGTVEYTLPSGREKVVHYWAAEVDEHALELAKFTPNSEIASLEWMPIEKVRKKLSYPHDAEVIDRFAELLITGRARTFAVIAVRHGKAVPPGTWDGPDSSRPLMQRGADQASQIAAAIAAYGPTKIISSTAVRCRSTIEPLSQLTGLPVKTTAGISQDAFEYGQGTVEKIVGKRLRKQKTVVLCSHGPVLPQIVGEVAAQTMSAVTADMRRSVSLGTGDFTVLHVSCEHPLSGLVAVETHSPD